MLPVLPNKNALKRLYRDYLEAILAAGFTGECESGLGHRMLQSTDNSIYQIVPDAVVYPRGTEDLQILARVVSQPEFTQIVLRPRGGGTGTNGQSLGNGIVVDVSRHMNRILEIDPERRVALVQAGVVKDQLQKALREHGLFFPPELSTSNRATIGGMISTDASGQGSVLYGKTRHHISSISLVLRDGTLLETGKAELDPSPLASAITQELDGLEQQYAGLWGEHIPQLNRNVTGYDLAHLRRADGGLDLASVIVGSEGTLGLIATAELKLTPIPKHTGMVTVVYPDFVAMLKETPGLMGFGAASIEVVDQRVLDLSRGDASGAAVSGFFKPGSDGTPPGGAFIIEFVGDTAEDVEARMAQLMDYVTAQGNHLSMASTLLESDIVAVWSMRKRAVGMLGNVKGKRAPVPFVEDTAVPPEMLPDYIAGFRAVLDEEGLSYGMFGHADAGVLHVRPDLDLSQAADRAKMRRVSDAVFALTHAYGGVLWGEHGKGVRSAYSPEFFGPLYPAVQSVKRLFDPNEQFNPGKVASLVEPLKPVDAYPLRGEREEKILAVHEDGFSRALNCNGNGACFEFELDAPMCPSWKATRDRRQSPKGRATLVREWLRQADEAGYDAKADPAPANLAKRAWATATQRQDFSHEVKAVFDTCLGCKACKGSCPIKVDVPAFKSRFLNHYHSRYLRSLADRLVADIELLLPLLVRFGPLYRILVQSKLGSAVMRKIGLTALPSLPKINLAKALAQRGVKQFSLKKVQKLSDGERALAVAIVPDAFVKSFDPKVLIDAVDVVIKLGFEPFILEVRNGKPLHAKGLLPRFSKVANASAKTIRAVHALGVPLVGIDPAMTLVYRDEYLEILGEPLPVMLLEEWLSKQIPAIAGLSFDGPDFILANHCTAQTNATGSSKNWQSIFEAAGASLAAPTLGCCGMAGTFGHETANRALSEEIYGLSWAKRVDNADKNAPQLLATGFSCRCQAQKLSHVDLPHPVSALLKLVA
jgi:FAD/FMN-containing dehydrogenase/Fe-S oxidoreductase